MPKNGASLRLPPVIRHLAIGIAALTGSTWMFCGVIDTIRSFRDVNFRSNIPFSGVEYKEKVQVHVTEGMFCEGILMGSYRELAPGL
jgi:hypothetical protein